jgi:hypothetical protein
MTENTLLTVRSHLFSFIGCYADIVELACVCRAFQQAVNRFPWALDQDITMANRRLLQHSAYEYVERWRRLCPRATHCTVQLGQLQQGDAAYFAGLRTLSLRSCGQVGRRRHNLDEALAHARDLRRLTIANCHTNWVSEQLVASNMAFAAQHALRRLEIAGPIQGAQNRVLHRLFAPLLQLEELHLSDLSQTMSYSTGTSGANASGAITGASTNASSASTSVEPPLWSLGALPAPSRLRRLTLSNCSRLRLDDSALRQLTGLTGLTLVSCPEITLTPRAFASNVQLETLRIDGCARIALDDSSFIGLTRLRSLVIANSAARLTNAAIAHLQLHVLKLTNCPHLSRTIANKIETIAPRIPDCRDER